MDGLQIRAPHKCNWRAEHETRWLSTSLVQYQAPLARRRVHLLAVAVDSLIVWRHSSNAEQRHEATATMAMGARAARVTQSQWKAARESRTLRRGDTSLCFALLGGRRRQPLLACNTILLRDELRGAGKRTNGRDADGDRQRQRRKTNTGLAPSRLQTLGSQVCCGVRAARRRRRRMFERAKVD